MASSIGVADSVITAILKLSVAKVADVMGTAETYCLMLIFYLLSCTLRFGSTSFGMFATGSFWGIIAHGGTQILILVSICNLTTMRMRGLAGNAFYLPTILTSWVAGIVVERMIAGSGWRWGYGMFAVIMPVAFVALISSLFALQRQARTKGQIMVQKPHAMSFCSQVDLGGLVLLSGGLLFLLLSITITSEEVTNDAPWMPSWAVVSMMFGTILLLGVIPHERYWASCPAIPVRYFWSRAITASILIAICDSLSFAATHVYLLPWSIAAHDLDAQSALYLTQINGVTQLLTGLVVGCAIYHSRHYRRFAIAGGIVRCVGYALMLRWRNPSRSTAELFSTQALLGAGRGLLETTILLIYLRNMKSRLRFRLGNDVTESFINDVFASITGTLLAWGTSERMAVAQAYSDMMGYFTIVALGISPLVVGAPFVMPDYRLTDGLHLVQT
ncbi:hypothetical protein CERZMDRAFT_108645 [Cercospora zeae-maydis SCOH1-5]|uniref:Major facilitator superfamily (MFS) profile domain-containing protein n=1 Tax=Cercospora zeae-maydis SCOH1-5 TaxID=717836 RepID=A0A6A6FXH4_9PEZI|nr:hypothetical protein CERZMDRAFT_108645 [Cercospora zeae-maydis SCOH1-5]